MITTDPYPDNVKNPAILSGKGVTKRFGGLTAVDGVEFELFENEILGLIGPNGAGKTTLFHLIAGVHRPDRGTIIFRGKEITGLRPDSICQLGIGRTFQITKPFLQMSTIENVMVGAYFGSRPRRRLKQCRARAEEILEHLGLIDKLRTPAAQLTLVERKRLEFARALATEPRLLLLDEVIAGLNPTETMELVEFIKQIRHNGLSILMIEHVMRAVMGLSDRVIVLQYGQKIAEGNPEQIVSNPEVVKAYLGGTVHALSE
jgi:branched-chain amino acid transport system ATP-binding protein